MAVQPATCPERRAVRFAVTAMCVVLVLASCSTATPTRSSSPTFVPSGGTIRIGLPASTAPFLDDVKNLMDPGGEPAAWFRRCCTARTLLSYRVSSSDVAATGGAADLVADLATSLPSVSGDGLTWTFELRPNLHYAPPFDKEIVSSEDVVRSIERTTLAVYPLIPDVEGLDAFLDEPSQGLAGLETPDERTLVVRLTHPDGDLPHRLALAATAPVPASALKDGALLDFVSTGPYMVRSATASGAVLVRNPSWSRASDPLRPANLDEIDIVPVDDPAAGDRAVKAGSLDLITEHLGPDAYQQIVQSGDTSHLVAVQDNAVFLVALNVVKPPLDDVHVRRAIALLIDRRAVANNLEGSRGTAFQTIDHVLPDIVLNGLLSDYRPLQAGGESGSLSAAQAEMRLSHYDADGDGSCDRAACDNFVVLSIFGEDANASLIAGQLSAIGIHAVVKHTTASPPRPDSYQMVAVEGWNTFGPMPSDYALLWTESGIAGGANFALTGATHRDLRGIEFRGDVPSLEAQTNFCTQHAGSSAFRCWAQLDQLLMEQVVGLVPIGTRLLAYRISDRIASVDMSPTEGIPAIDTITVRTDAATTD